MYYQRFEDANTLEDLKKLGVQQDKAIVTMLYITRVQLDTRIVENIKILEELETRLQYLPPVSPSTKPSLAGSQNQGPPSKELTVRNTTIAHKKAEKQDFAVLKLRRNNTQHTVPETDQQLELEAAFVSKAVEYRRKNIAYLKGMLDDFLPQFGK